MNYRIFPPEDMIEASVQLPLSKSICNRLLIINALTPGSQPLEEIADCDDSRVLREALVALAGGASEVNIGAAGTAMRFLTAYAAATDGVSVTIDGSERMRRRPMKVLVEALRTLGAEIEYAGEEGFAPLKIKGKRLKGGALRLDATVSSQFVSALMMVAPTMDNQLTITLDGEITSRPYIAMTAGLMSRAGADVTFERDKIIILPGAYAPVPQKIERDWSAASYWYEISALSAGFITLPGLETDSLQGDRETATLFTELGVNTEPSEETPDALDLLPSPEQFSRFEHDLSETPDLAQTFAVTAAALGVPFHLRGLSTLPSKETDRLSALKAELDKIGIIAEIRNGSELVWNGERHPIFELPRISTYDDHRMAMAFAPLAVFIPGIVIENIEVVSKSYPRFWADMQSAGFIFADADAPLPAADEETNTEEEQS